MPPVFTIYNCGTNFNRQRLDELTANLASRTEGREFIDWMVNDGPGSIQVDPRTGRAPKDDMRPVSAAEKALRDKATLPGHQADDPNPAFITRLHGLARGLGWETNTRQSIEVLKWLVRRGDAPRVVNMLGWSRGGITCHMIAMRMAQDPVLRRMRVNIFAIDPVAGPGSKSDWDKGQIPATVNEYACVLMEDEKRWMMSPTVVSPNGAGGSRHLQYPMPGAHNTGVMIHAGPVGEIVQHLAHNFLSRHETRLRSQIRLAPEKQVEVYALIRLQLGEYRNKGMGLMRLLGKHKRDSDFENAERDKMFINPHHRMMFKAAYPTIANVLFAKSLVDYKAQIAGLASRWPATHAWLTTVGKLG